MERGSIVNKKEEIKQQWHNLVTIHKIERQKHDVSSSSESGSIFIVSVLHSAYIYNWKYLKIMSFVKASCNVDNLGKKF